MPTDTRLHRLLVALLGVQVKVNAPLHARFWANHQHVSVEYLQGTRVHAPTILWLSRPPAEAYWQWVRASPAPLVTVITSVQPWPCADRDGQIQVPRRVRGAPVPQSPVQRAPILLTPHSAYAAGSTPPGPQDASPGAPRRPSIICATWPGYRPPPPRPGAAPQNQALDFPSIPYRPTGSSASSWLAGEPRRPATDAPSEANGGGVGPNGQQVAHWQPQSRVVAPSTVGGAQPQPPPPPPPTPPLTPQLPHPSSHARSTGPHRRQCRIREQTQRPNDDCPSTQVVPLCHGAGHNVPPVWSAAGNGAPPGSTRPSPMSGGRPERGLRRGLTVMWGAGLHLCATSCGSWLFWSNVRLQCRRPP